MLRFLGFIVTIILISVHSSGQQVKSVWDKSIKPKTETRMKGLKKWQNHLEEWGLDSNYDRALSVAGHLNSNGLRAGVLFSKKKTANTTFFQLAFAEVKHEKQVKIEGKGGFPTALGRPTPYIFGKINNLYLLEFSVGKEILLLPGIMEGSASMSFRYNCGVGIAMLKPYYLNVVYKDSVEGAISVIERFEGKNIENFLDADSIIGAYKWDKGLNQTRFSPGLVGEACLILQPNKTKSFIEKTSFGVHLSMYMSSLAIMADQKAYPFVANFFIGIEFGKQWKSNNYGR